MQFALLVPPQSENAPYAPAFTIDNPEFEKHILDIYPTELRLNKANTSDKETSFLDLNIKLLAVMFISAFTTNAMT